jgi:hypothetical protein
MYCTAEEEDDENTPFPSLSAPNMGLCKAACMVQRFDGSNCVIDSKSSSAPL